MAANYKLHAPKCALPGCSNRVGYHGKKPSQPGTVNFKWWMFCSAHRTKRKNEVDNWKMKQGCANAYGHYGGTPCTCKISVPDQLDIHHKDRDHHNTTPSNVEVLCANCHRLVHALENEAGENNNVSKASTTALDPAIFSIG